MNAGMREAVRLALDSTQTWEIETSMWKRLNLWHRNCDVYRRGCRMSLCYKLMWAHQYCCPRSWRASRKPAVIARNTQLDAQPRATMSFIRVHRPQVSFSYNRDVQSVAQREMTRSVRSRAGEKRHPARRFPLSANFSGAQGDPSLALSLHPFAPETRALIARLG